MTSSRIEEAPTRTRKPVSSASVREAYTGTGTCNMKVENDELGARTKNHEPRSAKIKFDSLEHFSPEPEAKETKYTHNQLFLPPL